MGRRPPEGRSAGLVAAFQDLTDGLVTLVRQHLELVRYEIRDDAAVVGRHVASIGRHLASTVVFGTVVLVGYGLLNLSAVFFAGAAFGPLGMALASLVLAVINLWIGAQAGRMALQRLKDAEEALRESALLRETGMEFERDRQWVKEIRQIRDARETRELTEGS